MGAVRQEHGHVCAGVGLGQADAGAGGAFLGGRVLCAAKAATHAAEVGAGEACGAAAATAGASTEQAAEQVVNVDIGAGAATESAEGVRAGVSAAKAATAEATRTHACGAVAANLVVLLALLLVGEHVVGLGDFLELLLSLLVTGVQIRVVLAGELAVRLLNVAFACVFANAQCLIKVVSYPVFACHMFVSPLAVMRRPPRLRDGQQGTTFLS